MHSRKNRGRKIIVNVVRMFLLLNIPANATAYVEIMIIIDLVDSVKAAAIVKRIEMTLRIKNNKKNVNENTSHLF